MPSLFDFETPEQVRASIGKAGREQDLSIAGLSGAQQANLGGAQAGRLLAQAIGGEDPRVTHARTIQDTMQTAQADAGDDLGKYYTGLAKGFKDAGLTKESMQALQALQSFNNQQAKIDQENRKVAAQEKTAEASATRAATGEAESIPGKDRLKVMQSQAQSAAVKAQAAMKKALAAAGNTALLKSFKSQPASTQQIKSVGTSLANDSVFKRLDEGAEQGAYVGTITQAASDLVAFGKTRGKTITFSQAQDAVKQMADKHVSNNTIFDDSFNKQGFMSEFLLTLK